MGLFPSEIREKTRGTYTLKGRKRKNAKKLRNFLETKLSLKKTIPFVVCYNVFVKIDQFLSNFFQNFFPKFFFENNISQNFVISQKLKNLFNYLKLLVLVKKKLKSSFESFSSQNKRLNSRNKFSVNKMTKQTFQQEVSHNFYKIFPWMDNKPEATFPLPLSHPCLQLPDNFHIFHEIYSIDQGTWLDGPGESVNMKNKRGEKRRHLNKDSYLPLWISSHMDRIVSASFDH